MCAEAMTTASAGISFEADWQTALTEVLRATDTGEKQPVDLVLMFASAHHRGDYERLVQAAFAKTGARMLLGCSGQGVIGREREVEGTPALSLLRLHLPGAELHPTRWTQDMLNSVEPGQALAEALDLPPSLVKGWLVLADPFHIDVERLIYAVEQTYPQRPIIGGLASNRQDEQRTYLFLNDQVYSDGGVGIAIGGAVTIRTIVSQGATPIGQPWTVTSARDNVLETIGGRPAYEVLVETIDALSPDVRDRALANLLIGLAMNEYRDEFGRGDFLIRNLMGVDRQSGAIAIGAYPRVGQTVQFQMRDGQAADEDLVEQLRAERAALGGRRPAAAMLCTCNGRGVGLFGVRDHDVGRIASELGPVPLAGFFCNGEIGPIGGKTFLHGFTASIALLLPADAEAG